MQKGFGGKRVALVLAMIIVIMLSLTACSGGGSSSSTPWGKLGVSKSEYDSVYNHYKYGTPIK